jgi:hypothetical protein
VAAAAAIASRIGLRDVPDLVGPSFVVPGETTIAPLCVVSSPALWVISTRWLKETANPADSCPSSPGERFDTASICLALFAS